MADINQGLFLPIVPLFDVGDLQDPTQARELIIRLTQKINDVIRNLNLKDTGVYIQDQYVNGQTWFANPNLSATTQQTPTRRQVFRKVFLTGPLPNTGTLLIPHNLAPTTLFTFTRIYGTASDTTGLNYIPIPQAFVIGSIVDLSVDAVNIIIHTNFNASNFDTVYIILEWLKN